MSPRLSVMFGVLLAAAACRRAAEPPPPAPPPEAATAAPTLAATKKLPFIDDDYERARAEAERRKLPLFVDVWASWCHTCLNIKQYVLPDPTLQPMADKFVWLAIDSERRSNAPFLQRYPSRSLPTLWVIDPRTQTPLLKWIGAATAAELHDLLADALLEQNSAGAAAQTGEIAEAAALASRGHRASAEGDAARAVDAFSRALSLAPPDWSKRPRTVEALSMRYAETGRAADTVALAAREAFGMPDGTARLNVVLNAIDASEDLPPNAPERETLPKLIALATQIATTASPKVLLDDRSSLYLSLIAALKASDPEASKRLSRSLSESLDAEAARAPTTAARMVWDPHRVEAYLAIGEAARAIPMLEQSEREAPDDYNPPARLARVYLTLERLEPARAAIDRALARSSGPRKLRLYMLKADILVAAKDKPGARAALREALEFARSSELPAQYDKLRQSIERRALELS